MFIGKYRGIVTDNNDPLKLGRIKARVPDVYGDEESGWATPCLPFGGAGVGLFAIPSVGAGVFMEFERGDAEYPLWVGCWWSKSEDTPPGKAAPPTDPKKFVIRTEGGHYILLDDSSNGGITIETSDGKRLVMDSNGVTLENGQGAKITLSSSQVSVNDGALEVM